MSTVSYREYLDILDGYNKNSISVVGTLTSFLAVILLVFTLSLYISQSSNKNNEPAQAQAIYFDSAQASFFKTKQSLGDLVASFQVAGEKTQKLDSSTQSSSSATPGFFITLGDTQNLIAQIKSTKENIDIENQSLKKTSPPSVYETLNNQLLSYQQESEDFLTSVQATQEGLKDLLLASGANFFLPTLSDESVWQSQDVDKIKAYYENRKKDAQNSLTVFSKISPRNELKDYKNLQLSYFQLVTNVSDNVLKILNKPPAADVSPDTPTNIEEAYQLLTTAKRDNEIIAQKLFDEKLKLTSTSEIKDKVASLNNRAKIIESALSDGNKVQIQNPPVKLDLFKF